MKQQKHVPTAKELKSFAWYRFLNVFFWIFVIAMFILPIFRETCIEPVSGGTLEEKIAYQQLLRSDQVCRDPNLIEWFVDGITLSIIWAIILYVIWKIIFYIAYGSFSCSKEVTTMDLKKPKTESKSISRDILTPTNWKALSFMIPLIVIIALIILSYNPS